jgi:Spy/CpxP family protein refolding chaperone
MRKKILCSCVGLILAGLAAAGLAWAQPGGPGGGMGGGFQDRFQQIKRTQMGPALGISQQTVDQLLQIQARYQPMRRQLIQSMKADYQRLQQVMSQPSPPEQEVSRILTEMKRKKREMEDLQTRQGQEEDALLTPVQQARYLMYQRSLLREARSVKREGEGETMPMMPQGPREIPVSRPAR